MAFSFVWYWDFLTWPRVEIKEAEEMADDLLKRFLGDTRIDEDVKNEYKPLFVAIEDVKGLCDDCGYYRPLTNELGYNLCELCRK
jgi:hypothetical protein